MSTTASNALQSVQTYQESGLAYLGNTYAYIANANKKFLNFEKLTANLGDTVTFDTQPLFSGTSSLVANFGPAAQKVETLTVNKEYSVAFAFSAQQFIFNAKEYMEKFGKSAQRKLATQVEKDCLSNILTSTYRYFGDGTTEINSYGQLARALAYYRNYGHTNDGIKTFIPDISEPAIVNTGLNQFVLKRNEESAQSWEIGNYSGCDFLRSNLLPIQYSGSCGEKGDTLTVATIHRNSDNAIDYIVCSGVSTSTGDAVKAGDVFTFQDGVTGKQNVRFMTYEGQVPSSCPVQCLVTTTAAVSSGSVTINLSPLLYDLYAVETSAHNGTIDPDKAYLQNVNITITTGTQIKVAKSHIAGTIVDGNAAFLAMPQLPEEIPYPTANLVDPDSALSFRQYYGSKFAENTRGMVHDCIWGNRIVPQYAMRICFPLSVGGALT
ncbi:hypothetical protein HGB13_00270 [bacterium]|nr:hypothetical protein [bacterium]